MKFLQHPRNVRGYRGNGVSCGISIFLVDQDAFRARLIFKEFWGGGGGERGGMEWTSFINKIRKGDDKIGNVIIVGMNDNSKKLINIEKNVDTKLEIIQKSM